MNLFVTISFTLLVMLASLFYLMRVRRENAGPFFRFSGWIIFAAASVLFLFLIFKGVKRLMRHDHRDHRAMQMHHEGKRAHGKMKGDGKDECGSHEACCSKMHHNGDSTYYESATDTIGGKIIRKEIKITKE